MAVPQLSKSPHCTALLQATVISVAQVAAWQLNPLWALVTDGSVDRGFHRRNYVFLVGLTGEPPCPLPPPYSPPPLHALLFCRCRGLRALNVHQSDRRGSAAGLPEQRIAGLEQCRCKRCADQHVSGPGPGRARAGSGNCLPLML